MTQRPCSQSRQSRPKKTTRPSVSFSPVSSGDVGTPLRMFDQGGHCQGVFTSPAMATAARRLLVRVSLWFLIVLPLFARAAGRPASDVATLHAIAIVEDWRGHRGAQGELYEHQMMPATYARYTGTPAQRAAKHLAYLKRLFAEHGIAPVPFNLALAWNAGEGNVLRSTAPVSSYDYACRVVATLEAGR